MRVRFSALSIAILLAAGRPALADNPNIIDTHAHILATAHNVNVSGSLDGAVKRMDRFGIAKMIVMPPPSPSGAANAYEIDSLASVSKTYGGRILPGGGGGSLNGIIQSTSPENVTDEAKRAFRARAEAIARQGAVVFGEIALQHLSLRTMGPQHAYEWVAADHPLLFVLADVAAEKGIPIDFHLDIVPEDMSLPDRPILNPSNPKQLKENVAAFERLLAHNPAAKIVWAHAGTDPLGTRTPQLQRELLSRHPNLFMSLRVSATGPAPVAALDGDKKLKPVWLALLRDFPDRFVIGTDFFHGSGSAPGRGAAEEALENYRTLIAQLPPPLAEAVAHGNAERIYGLPAQ